MRINRTVGLGGTLLPKPLAKKELPQATGWSGKSSFEPAKAPSFPKPVLDGGPITPPQSPPSDDGLVGLKVGDRSKGKGDTRISTLQDDLQKLGLLPADFNKPGKSGGEYGAKIGFHTDQAIRALQRNAGLPETGVVDDATRQALLGQRLLVTNQTQAMAGEHRAELGAPKGQLYVTMAGDGHPILKQDYEHGYTLCDPILKQVEVHGADGALVDGPRPLGTTGDIATAQKWFVNQEGQTSTFEVDLKKNGNNRHPDGPNDCGPTSVAMSLMALGLLPKPDAKDAPAIIANLRKCAEGTETPDQKGMGFGNLKSALDIYGAKASGLDGSKLVKGDFTDLNAALDRGHPVIIGGVPGNAWAKAMHKNDAGSYLDMGVSGNAGFDHFCAILGKDKAGNYLVGDPLAKGGVMTVKPEDLKKFFVDGSNQTAKNNAGVVVSAPFYGAIEVQPK